MKNVVLVFILISLTNVLFGQEINEQLVEIALPSPTAFEMTKYGNIPVNESSGRISPSIPIYNYVAGKISVPISLNYTGNGVKVDQLSSWTGINWNLSAGGAITRIVNDLPDDHVASEKRIMYSHSYISESLESENRGDFIYKLNDIAQNKLYDTQLDIFQFSIPGYSGSFYLDKQLNPVLANYEFELRIMIKSMDQYGIKEFFIVDPQGVIYNFGENYATEQTMINPNSTEKFSAITSFFLTSIVHPMGDSIYFEYNPEGDSYFVRLSQSFHISKVYAHTADVCPAPSTNMNYSEPNLNLSKILDGKYLSRIYSSRSDLSINFNSDPSNYGDEYKRVLNRISIYHKSTLVEKVELSYIRNDQRFFLNKVLFNGNTSQGSINKPYEYKMDYNGPEGLPDRLSYRQDHLGYFNNKNNQTLIPKTTSSFFQEINSYLANREPDFFYASKGTLTNLYYPTGGFTHFEYEAPPIKQLAKRLGSLEAYCKYQGLVPDTKLTDFFSIGPEVNEDGTFIIPPAQTINIKINVTANENVNHHYVIFIKVEDVEYSTEEISSFVLAPDITSYYREFSFNLKENHLYRIKLEIVPNPESQMDPYFVYANATFDYTTGYENGEGLGIRIKRVLDYSSPTSTPTIKRYYYKRADRLDGESESSTSIATTGSYLYTSTYISCCQRQGDIPGAPTLGDFTTYELAHLQSNSLKSLFPTSDNAWLYNTVTISYGGDNFENGGLQKKFKIIEPSGPYSFFGNNSSPHEMERENSDMYNSKLENEAYLTKGNGDSLFIIKSIDYKYNGMDYVPITNMIASRLYNICSGGASEPIADNYHTTDGLYIGLFGTFSKTLYIDSIITTDFIDPLNVKSKNFSLNKRVISKTGYNYGGLVGLPIEIIKTSSNIDRVFKSKIYYTTQGAGLIGLTPEEKNNYATLHYLHILSTPIQTENYVGNDFTLPELEDPDNIPINNNDSTSFIKKLSTNRVVYGSNLLPKKVQTSLGNNPLEDKIYCHVYDNYENPLEIVKANDISTVYIWGYKNSQPIAKIENASYADVYGHNLYINSLQTLSDNEINQISENALRDSLDKLRNFLPSAMVTTYTYDLPYGASSITDPNGLTTYYSYDQFGRLKSVEDDQYKKIKEYSILFQEQNIQNYTGYYEITAESNEFGTITLSSKYVKAGGTCNISFNPIAGYHIQSLIINNETIGSVSSNYTIENIQSNKQIQAVFAINKYNITTSKNSANGTITASCLVDHGNNKTISISANTGYHIANVIVDGVSKGIISSYTFNNVTAAHTIHVDFAINTYPIYTSMNNSNGSITPTCEVEHGSSKTIFISANSGYHIKEVIVDEIPMGVITSYTFSNITLGHTISVEFEINSYTITATKNAGGTILPINNSTVTHGSSKTYTFIPSTGYHIKDVKVNGVSVGVVTSYAFSNVTSNQTLYVEFEINSYTITATKNAGGTMSPTGNSTVTHGAGKTYTFTPSTGYHIKDVKVNGTSVGAVTSYTFSNITSNQTLNVEFEINSYTISVIKGTTSGTISPTGNSSVTHGSSITYSFTPSPGYHIKDVRVNGTSVGAVASYTFNNVTSNQSLIVSFEINSYTISFNSQGGSAVSAKTANYNSTILAPSSPTRIGYTFAGWYKESTCINAWNFSTDKVTTNTTLYAKWDVNTYTVSFNSQGGSAVSAKTANYNSTITAPSSPTFTGYNFAGWFKESTCINAWNFSTDKVTTNTTLYAKWSIKTFTITATRNNSFGSITPAGTSTVNYGSNLTYTITPSTGNHIKDVKVNGTSVGVVTSYTFSNIKSNQSISVEFEINTYTIYASKTGSGTMTPSGNTTLGYNSSITYTFAPSPGYHIKQVLVDEIPVGAVSSYAFNRVANNHTISVEFEPDIYLNLSTTNLYYGLPISSQSFSISSSVSWTITKDAAWLIITPVSGSNNATITVNCGRLRSGERTGTITVTGGGITKTIIVYQGEYAQ